MHLKSIVLTILFTASMVAGVDAADSGHGKISFTGAIIDAPCSISPESTEQTVDLGQISSAALKANSNAGTSTPKNFTIALDNCTLTPGQNSVTTTFTGAEGLNGKLGITGNASGAGIVLTDGASNKITLGQATSPQVLQDGNNTLLFSAYLQGDGASAAITSGDFASVADFTLAYE